MVIVCVTTIVKSTYRESFLMVKLPRTDITFSDVVFNKWIRVTQASTANGIVTTDAMNTDSGVIISKTIFLVNSDISSDGLLFIKGEHFTSEGFVTIKSIKHNEKHLNNQL